MSDSKLRSGLIRLAHAKPELREHLLPILREAGLGRTLGGMPIPDSEAGRKYADAAREAKLFAASAANARDDSGRSTQHAQAGRQHFWAAHWAKELGDLKGWRLHKAEQVRHNRASDEARKSSDGNVRP